MTRAEFDGGWLVLRGVWPRADQNPEIYFGVLGALPSDTWLEAVKTAVLNADYFPTPAQLLEAAYAAERRAAESAHGRALLEDPTNPAKFEHPSCKREPNESAVAYAARLAVALGFMAKGDDSCSTKP